MTAQPEATPAAGPQGLVQPVGTIAGVYLIRSEAPRDSYGFISRAPRAQSLKDAGIDPRRFVYDSTVRTRQAAVRGLRLSRGQGEATLVRCLRGVMASAVVDLRPHSPTFSNVFMVELKTDPPMTLYVPPGCAHGFQSLTEPCDTNYRVDLDPDLSEGLTVPWDNPDLGIQWPLRPIDVPLQPAHTATITSLLGFAS